MWYSALWFICILGSVLGKALWPEFFWETAFNSLYAARVSSDGGLYLQLRREASCFRFQSQLSSYPLLADEVGRTINLRIREVEVKAKDQIQQLVDFQLAYMNTNHEDFVGFSKCVYFDVFLAKIGTFYHEMHYSAFFIYFSQKFESMWTWIIWSYDSGNLICEN